jgi:hypothetical protein
MLAAREHLSAPLRLLIVGRRDFSRPLARALENVTTVDVLGVASTAEEATALAERLEPVVLIVEPALADAVDGSMTEGQVVLAPWVAKWRESDETSSVSRTDLVVTAALLGSACTASPLPSLDRPPEPV